MKYRQIQEPSAQKRLFIKLSNWKVATLPTKKPTQIPKSNDFVVITNYILHITERNLSSGFVCNFLMRPKLVWPKLTHTNWMLTIQDKFSSSMQITCQVGKTIPNSSVRILIAMIFWTFQNIAAIKDCMMRAWQTSPLKP